MTGDEPVSRQMCLWIPFLTNSSSGVLKIIQRIHDLTKAGIPVVPLNRKLPGTYEIYNCPKLNLHTIL